MCVAAVGEAVIEALNEYFIETGDQEPFQKLPASQWTTSANAKSSIRAQLWKYDGAGSRGARDAFSRLDIGEAVEFKNLMPGDAVTIDRSDGTGHAVVFLNFVDIAGHALERFSKDAAGFHYFSAQKFHSADMSGNEHAGFGFKTEFFVSKDCPVGASCRVLPPDSRYGPNSGRVWFPNAWGDIGSTFKAELERAAYQKLTGRPIPKNYVAALNSLSTTDAGQLEDEVQSQLNAALDPNKLPNWSDAE
jgi:hypothetical protein